MRPGVWDTWRVDVAVLIFGKSPAFAEARVTRVTSGKLPVNDRHQRGYVRPGGGVPNCTIGVYECAALPPRYPGPALSPLGLLGPGALLGAAGSRKARRASAAR